MAARGKPRRFRLAAVLCFALLASPWLTAQQKPKSRPAHQWVKLSPEVAATHLIKKVAPIYPAFAKAAGIQGVVRVGVSISPDGRVHSIGGPVTGWACLWKAAMTAASQYFYRPFVKDGHPTGAQTAVDIAFKLPSQHSVFHPPAPPQLTFGDFTSGPHVFFQNATPVADGPPEIRKWLVSQMQKNPLYSLWAKHGAFKSMKYGLPAKIVEIPTGVPTSRIYLITDNVVSPGFGLGAVLCGGNCDIWLVEDDGGVVRDGIRTAGRWFYVWRRKGSIYPDIFIAFSTPYALDVYGYANAGGYWGLLYYGSILGTSHEDIHVFNHWRAPTLAARKEPQIPPIQQFFKLPPQVTATHLIKKVAPIYPPFAKAAGIQEVSRVPVVIYPDGHIHSQGGGPATGWACLQQAAGNAAAGYVYRPFMKDGHPIYVETTEDIVFKLPGHHGVFHPPPPPHLTDGSFNGFRDTTPVADGPPEIRKWVLSQMRKDWTYSFQAKRGQWKGLKYGLPANMVEIPTGDSASRIYIITDNVPSPSTGYSLCGNGGCDIWWVVDDAGTVRDGYRSGGWGFYVWRRKGSPYPDIFTAGTTGPEEVDVDGYANIGGHWGVLYCGTIQHGVHVCR